MKPKVFVTREIPERGLSKIKEFFEVDLWTDEAPPPKRVILEKVRDVDALVSLLTDPIDAEIFDAAPKLRIVSQYAVG
ncbi:MAG TPA: D-glycerate dehydrogenase, partial [Candidatus Korarchaeota archaeon]|nr:D-glycerate dehydrogenase [Candidatus Korarchaeota archaeon]